MSHYTFVSDFAKEDIEITLREIFPEEIETKLILQEKITGPWSGDHLCSVQVKLPDARMFSWPKMLADQAQVFKDIKMQ